MSKNPKVAIIDYKMCNLYSVAHACKVAGLEPVITSEPEVIDSSDGVILPGVGAFGDAIKNLTELKLIKCIKKAVTENKPFMGICLGFQLLFSESEEFGQHTGINVFSGKVLRFPNAYNNKKLKVPYIGWNTISITKESPFLSGIRNDEYMYFVHSFYVETADSAINSTVTDYCGFQYCSSVERGNLFACQFHPEKSSVEGMKIYYNWAKLLKA